MQIFISFANDKHIELLSHISMQHTYCLPLTSFKQIWGNGKQVPEKELSNVPFLPTLMQFSGITYIS